MHEKSGSLVEWVVPLCFILCAGWMVWHLPAFTLDWFPPDETAIPNLLGLHHRNDVTPGMAGPFGGEADWIDYAALIGLPIFMVLGIRTVRRAPMEFEAWRAADRAAVFIGRVTMMLIVLLTSVMIYEVLLRYVFEARPFGPTNCRSGLRGSSSSAPGFTRCSSGAISASFFCTMSARVGCNGPSTASRHS